MSETIEVTAGRVRVESDGWRIAGRAVDCRGVVRLETARDATDAWVVRDEPASLRVLLARAARSWGMTAPQDDRIAALEAELAETDRPTTPELAPIRREVAESDTEIDRLRERVATLRGRLEERRADGGPTDGLESKLREAIETLTEVETQRLAARQRLTLARQRVRRARDRRERRLRLRDELDNRRRDARAALAERLYEPFAAVVRQLPGQASPGREPAAYTGSPVTARLGAVAVAAGDRPAVLAVNPFDDLQTAAERVAAPVIRVAPPEV